MLSAPRGEALGSPLPRQRWRSQDAEQLQPHRLGCKPIDVHRLVTEDDEALDEIVEHAEDVGGDDIRVERPRLPGPKHLTEFVGDLTPLLRFELAHPLDGLMHR